MSSNQSRFDRTQSSQYRNSGRSSRNFTGGGSKVSATSTGGGATAHPPSSTSSINSNISSNNNPALSTNRSFKKHNNVQGGQQSRGGAASGPAVNSVSNAAVHALQNGAHMQQPFHGASDLPITSTTVNPTAVKPIYMAIPKASRAQRTPPSSVSVPNSDYKPPTTPVIPTKAPVDGSFSLQFGSISPINMNGMQVPPRTTSAPPNLDEQEHEQAHHDSLRAQPTQPTPPAQSVPKQQLAKKDAGIIDQSISAEIQPTVKPKGDGQVSASPPVSQSQKQSVHPTPGMPMQMPFHQQQGPVKFGGPNPQIQAQAMSASLPISMQIPLQTPPLPPQMFLSGLQPHPMHTQSMLHQGHISFTSHLGPQRPPQLGNIGMNLMPQFPQLQAGNYGSTRKAVKITHPDTHEELRLDGSAGPRSHSNVPQSHPIPSFSPTPSINYYPTPGTYSAGSTFFPATTSLPLNKSQPPSSQPSRHTNQVTLRPAASSNVEDSSSSVSSPRATKVESGKLSRPSQKDSQASSHFSLQQPKPDLVLASSSFPGEVKAAVVLDSASVHGRAYMSMASTAAVPVRDSSIASLACENSRPDAVYGPAQGKSQQQVDDKGDCTLRREVGGHSAAVSSVPTQEEPGGALGKVNPSPVTNVIQDVLWEPVTTVVAAESDAFGLNHDQAEEHTASDALKVSVGGLPKVNQANPEASGKQEKGEMLPEDLQKEHHNLDGFSESITIDLSKDSSVIEEGSLFRETCISEQSDRQEPLETMPKKLQNSEKFSDENNGVPNLIRRSCAGDEENGEMSLSAVCVNVEVEKDAGLESESRPAIVDSNADVVMATVSDKEPAPVSVLTHAEENLACEDESVNSSSAGSVASLSSDVKEKSLPESHVVKSTATAPRGKKKRKELLKKYENTAPASDLYLAYKGPKEKVFTSKELSTNISGSLEPSYSHLPHSEVSNEDAAQSKLEPEDWEDAEIPTPKLETAESRNQVVGSGEDGTGAMKKYSRDFLLIFADQCTGLPEGFEFAPDIAEALMVSNANISPESYGGNARIIDRPTAASRLDRRGSGLAYDGQWSKLPGPLMTGRDMRLDNSNGPNMVGFQPNQFGNYGVVRNPRVQTPVHYPVGIFSGQMPSFGPQVVLPRNSSVSERWQRGTAFQKGLMPSPHTPLQIMHKAENKYEIGKVSDEEAAKQRQLKAILNKLTPQNFEKLFEQVKQVNIDNVVTLTGVISQIFDKALMEPTFCEMYANFCHHLAQELPDLNEDNQRITFKRLLLNKCQEEFERGEREQEEANKADEEGAVKQSEGEREQKRLNARRKMLGNIRLIGELYKKRMLTERIMHECIKKLLGQYQNPDEEDIEALCKLMSTIGEIIDHPKAKEHMDAYFDMMAKLSNNMKLSSRVRFMLKDAIDLRKNNWQQRRKVEGPKKIDEVHRDAAQERQAQATRLARTPSMGSSVRRGQPMDFSPRGSMLASTGSQSGGFRAVPSQLRGYGVQGARMDDRHVPENRTLSVPLPQRPLADDSVTLGPQGGLARGMSLRGHPASPGVPQSDNSSTGDSRRMGVGLNGYDPVADRPAYSMREEPLSRQMPQRLSVYDQSSRDDRNADHRFDPSLSLSSATHGGTQTSTQNVSSERVWSDDHLRDMSIAAIKEFYSAKDENEVALCIKDLNNPNFYPNMIALWVNDSFEKKDMERDLLAKLLIYLTKSQGGMISQSQLINGLVSVLMNLEDAVNDAPRAAEFLGRVFARLALENIISLTEIGRLVYEGGEEAGRLVEIGLAAEVLGTVLEIMSAEACDSMLDEIRSMRLENFRPPGSSKSSRLDKFM